MDACCRRLLQADFSSPSWCPGTCCFGFLTSFDSSSSPAHPCHQAFTGADPSPQTADFLEAARMSGTFLVPLFLPQSSPCGCSSGCETQVPRQRLNWSSCLYVGGQAESRGIRECLPVLRHRKAFRLCPSGQRGRLGEMGLNPKFAPWAHWLKWMIC